MLIDEIAGLDFGEVFIVSPAFFPELLVVCIKDLVPRNRLLVPILSVLLLYDLKVIVHVCKLQLLPLQQLSLLVHLVP